MQDNTISVALLDFGSHSIKGALVEKSSDGTFSIRGHEIVDSEAGIRRGIIVNLKEVASKARHLLDQLEQLGNCKISRVYVGVNGQSLHSMQHEAETVFAEPHEIIQPDVDELLDEMANVNLERYEILGEVTPSYYVNGAQTSTPVGMKGLSLKTRVQLILARNELLENIQSVLQDKLGLEVEMNLAPMALAEKFLTPEQQRIGSVIVDMGAGSTSVSVYYKGGLLGLRVIPLGAQNITYDLTTTELHISMNEAERIKINSAEAISDTGDDREVEVRTADHLTSKKLPLLKINRFVEARATEIIDNVKAFVFELLPDKKIPGGVVITGGGSKLAKIRELIATSMNTEVEFAGNTHDIGGSSAFFRDKPEWHVIYSMIPYADQSSIAPTASEQTHETIITHRAAHEQGGYTHPEDLLDDRELMGGTESDDPVQESLFNRVEMEDVTPNKAPVNITRSSRENKRREKKSKGRFSSFLKGLFEDMMPSDEEDGGISSNEA